MRLRGEPQGNIGNTVLGLDLNLYIESASYGTLNLPAHKCHARENIALKGLIIGRSVYSSKNDLQKSIKKRKNVIVMKLCIRSAVQINA